jgi:hypothetical protein
MTASDDPAKPHEPFNSDGYWKAIVLEPDGSTLSPIPLTAIVVGNYGGDPRFYVYWNDTVMDCEAVPGFICAMGSDGTSEAMYKGVLDLPDALNRLAQEIPTTVLERLRSSIASDYGGRGAAYGQVVFGPVVREQVSGLLEHAMRSTTAAQNEITTRRAELDQAETELPTMAARVEELKALTL